MLVVVICSWPSESAMTVVSSGVKQPHRRGVPQGVGGDVFAG
jgi:hypothetical protein